MASTYTALGVELMATGENAGTWGTKTNTNLNIIEQISGGFSAQSIAGGEQTTALSVSDGSTGAVMSHRMIEFTGSITGNQIVTIPLDAQTFYFLRNSTSGAYTVQFKYASGSGDTFTFAATDKGDQVVFATANDGTNPDIYTMAFGDGDVTLTGTQTLTNKTLTSPKIGTSILDTNGNELAKLTATGSAVNEFTVANAATGGSPTLSATGGDSNIDLDLLAKGTGHVTIKGNTNPGTIQLNCENNSHGQQIKPQPHSVGSSAVHTLPNITGDLIAGKIEGTNFTDSLLVGHATTGTLNAAERNAGVGIGALDAITSGDSNVALGYNAGSAVNSGKNNILIGSGAGDNITTGHGNVIIGNVDAPSGTSGQQFKIAGSNYNGSSVVTWISGDSNAVVTFNAANVTQQALTSSSNAVAWDASDKPNAVHITTENTTFAAPTNNVEGAFIALEINYNGSHTIAFNTVFEFAASTAPTFTSTDGKTDILVFRYNGAVWQEVGRTLNLSES